MYLCRILQLYLCKTIIWRREGTQGSPFKCHAAVKEEEKTPRLILPLRKVEEKKKKRRSKKKINQVKKKMMIRRACWNSVGAVRRFRQHPTSAALAPSSQSSSTSALRSCSTVVTHNVSLDANHSALAEQQQSSNNSFAATVPVAFTPGSLTSAPGLVAPSTAITNHCDILSECVTQADELAIQMKVQAASGASGQILTEEGMQEFLEELKQTANHEMDQLLASVQAPLTRSPSTPSSSPSSPNAQLNASMASQLVPTNTSGGSGGSGQLAIQAAGMHEIRRALYYTTSLKERNWVEEHKYTTMMRALTVELLRRDNDGVLSADDVLYVGTHIVVANFYNRHLWNRLEKSMMKFSTFESLDMSSIKAFTVKLFRSRKGCPQETLDVRRKILNAMSRRVGTLANDFDLASLLGVLQCYAAHDLMPRWLEPLAQRASNHIADYTPHECATLSHVLRRWGLMRLETCEKIVERISATDLLTHHMATNALLSLRMCYNRISDGGRAAMNAEPMRLKLRAMGEQIGARLDEVTYPALPVVLRVLDVIVTMRIYVPKKCLQVIFTQANDMVGVLIDGKDELVDPKTQKRVRPVTAEEARQLQALLYHYGTELSGELNARLKQAFAEGLLPDEASMF